MSSSHKPGSSGSDGSKLNWMYQGPAALVNREDYLLGRSVDKSLKLLEDTEQGKSGFSYLDEVQKDLTPVSIFAPGPVGAIDVVRKIKEDPLFQIQKKEEENLKQLLKNPIRVKKLRELAEKNRISSSSSREQSSSKSKKSKKKKKKRGSSSSSSSSSDSDEGTNSVDIDKLLTAKLTSLKNATAPSATKRKHDSSDDDSDSNHKSKYHHKASSIDHSDRQSSSSSSRSHHYSGRDRDRDRKSSPDRSYSSSRRNDRDRSRYDDRDKRDQGSSRDNDNKYSGNYDKSSSSSSSYRSSKYSQRPETKKSTIDDAEKERRMKEMMENAKWRDEQRNKNVKIFQAEQIKEEEKLKTARDPDFIRKQLVEAATTGSVEKRIKSNSYNIQRSKFSMNQNFAKR